MKRSTSHVLDDDGEGHEVAQPRIKKPKKIGVPTRAKPGPTERRTFGQVVDEHNLHANEYCYWPLKDGQIRLLQLQPASRRADQLICFLKNVSLEQLYDNPYEALSYTWGLEEASEEIKVQTYQPNSSPPPEELRITPAGPTASASAKATDHLPPSNPDRERMANLLRKANKPLASSASPKRFYVTPNLENALRHFRDPQETLTLWVDAICIDQKNEVEKSQQVATMAEIYHKAESVILWLGNHDDTSPAAISFVEHILDIEKLDAHVTAEKSLKDWLAMAQLMRRDWFSRRWVVQELAMAKQAQLHVGDDSVYWSDFAEAVALFARESPRIANLLSNSKDYRYDSTILGDIRASGASSVVEITKDLFRWTDSPHFERLTSLETLVSSLLTFEATDPRDTIYALLSISKDVSKSFVGYPVCDRQRPGVESTILEADYSKNILEVFKDFVAYCIRSGSLDIICRAWAPNTRRPLTLKERIAVQMNPENIPKIELPSWIPLLADSPFGLPSQAPFGRRKAANSLVGGPQRRPYNAAMGTRPDVLFGEVRAKGKNAYS